MRVLSVCVEKAFMFGFINPPRSFERNSVNPVICENAVFTLFRGVDWYNKSVKYLLMQSSKNIPLRSINLRQFPFCSAF